MNNTQLSCPEGSYQVSAQDFPIPLDPIRMLNIQI